MPYKVVTPTTPLWADSKKTRDKGVVSLGEEFVCTEGYKNMLKTSNVQYMPKGAVYLQWGDGWLEAKNCAKVEPAGSTAVSTTGGVPVVFGKRKFVITVEEVE